MPFIRQSNKFKVPIIKGTLGLFVSPQGETLFLEQSHINTVILNPRRFGLTSQEIESEYSQYSEPLGVEGTAREKILRAIIVRGWIRLRRYVRPQEKWSATVHKLDE
ncbi:MAG: hypothetical protein ACLQPD_04480 [Desulfomonilaceae bacterium]